jgi:dihydrofolate reductase
MRKHASITLVVAYASNGVIGRDNAMPWRLPHDLARFKSVTMGHPVLMGRRTFESIGRALPGRRNIVVTSTAGWHAPSVEVVRSFDEAIELCGDSSEIFVIGGAQLYRTALSKAHVILATEIDREFEGDTHFVRPAAPTWRETSREAGPSGADDTPPYAFVRYERAD